MTRVWCSGMERSVDAAFCGNKTICSRSGHGLWLKVSVGVPDFVLKSAAMSLYSAGPFQKEVPKKNKIVNGVLNMLGLPKGPVEVKLTEVPTVSISQKSGVSVRVNVSAQSLLQSKKPSLPVMCAANMKFKTEGNYLQLVIEDARCKVKPQTAKGKMAKPVINLFLNGHIQGYIDSELKDTLRIPLPDGVNFSESEICYHDVSLH
ncbi:uncharacterized protein LOC115574916 [Sparus aurata]|uniref:uncharacterized protein LOC115574916 n=1 Tax=Sparus aurata TaxID=8175 RepID=UPI0011C125C6|nr:uncharacterized protein LOC115574916 [Sparus aurata]